MPSTDWMQVDEKYNFHCRKCDSTDIEYREVTSYDEAHEDLNYHCNGCGRIWWVEGSDY